VSPATRRPIWPALLLGASAGVLATIAVALASPGLYIDWGAFAGVLVVIPLAAAAAVAVVTVPLAALKRIAWVGVPVAVVTAIAAGELVFQATRDTGFARWSAARHWSAMERRAAADREAAERDVCRRLLAESPAPPAPRPPGGGIGRTGTAAGAATGTGLITFSRERCAALLAR
jgi:hypothetical protein